MQHYTTIEQSKKLLELGLNTETADMCYPMLYNRAIDGGGKRISNHAELYKPIGEDKPCWSLGALMELMPKIDNQLPSLRKYKNYYCVVYSDNVTRLGDNQWQNGKTPTEAAYNMIVWLIENGYIKKEK